MQWKLDGNAPIYAQLVERMKLGIVSGEWHPGQRIPAVRELAVEAGVNPNTMQRALQELEREGMVYSQRTSGRFVTEDEAVIDNAKKNLAEEQIKSFLEAMSKLGYGRDEIISLLEENGKEEKNNADT